MPCQPNSSSPQTMRTQIELLGFQLVSDTGEIQIYKYQQYTLSLNILTMKVEVYYGNGTRPFSYVFVSIISSFAELKKYLLINGVISV